MKYSETIRSDKKLLEDMLEKRIRIWRRGVLI
jgi:hypothetical protein